MNCATCDHPSGDHLEGRDACLTENCPCGQFVAASDPAPVGKAPRKQSAVVKPKSKTLAKKRG